MAAIRVSWLFHMPASFRKTSANRTTSRLVRLLLDMAPRTVLERCWSNTKRAADRRRRRRLDDNNDLCRDATPVAVAAAVDTTFAGRRTAVASPSRPKTYDKYAEKAPTADYDAGSPSPLPRAMLLLCVGVGRYPAIPP